jgi:hypothetical protein
VVLVGIVAVAATVPELGELPGVDRLVVVQRPGVEIADAKEHGRQQRDEKQQPHQPGLAVHSGHLAGAP